MGYLSAQTLDVTGGSGAFTVPSGCTFLLVKLAVATGAGMPSSITLGGTALTTVATRDNGDSLSAGVYSRTSPATGSLTLAHSNSSNFAQATLEYYDGINLVTPVRGSAATAGGTYATSFSLGVTSVAGDLCSDFIVIQENATATAGGSQTLIISNTFGTPGRMYASSRQIASGTTSTFSWTTNGPPQRQAQIAVALIPAQNPPLFDAAFVDVTGTSTLSVTVAANSNRVLYFYTDSTATSVARDGQSFTDIYGDGGLWRLIAPNTGTANIVASGTAPVNNGVMALSIYNASQTTPERGAIGLKTAMTGPWTSTVTTGINDLVIDFGSVRGSAFSTAESGQTERVETQMTQNLSWVLLSSTRLTTGTTTNMSWTGTTITDGYLYYFAVRPADIFDIALRDNGAGTFDISLAASGTTGQIKVWTGAAWVAKPVKVWSGSAWQIKPIKFYNGTIWVTTTY